MCLGRVLVYLSETFGLGPSKRKEGSEQKLPLHKNTPTFFLCEFGNSSHWQENELGWIVRQRNEGNSEKVTQETFALVTLCLEWLHLTGLESQKNRVCVFSRYLFFITNEDFGGSPDSRRFGDLPSLSSACSPDGLSSSWEQ